MDNYFETFQKENMDYNFETWKIKFKDEFLKLLMLILHIKKVRSFFINHVKKKRKNCQSCHAFF